MLAAVRDYFANSRPYENCIVNQKRPHTIHIVMSDEVTDHFATKAFEEDCYGYGRYIGSIVERYLAKIHYRDLLMVFAAHADVMMPILEETSR